MSQVDHNNVAISAPGNKAITQWTLAGLCEDSVIYSTNNTTTVINTVGSVHTDYIGIQTFHYTIDARLGV